MSLLPSRIAAIPRKRCEFVFRATESCGKAAPKSRLSWSREGHMTPQQRSARSRERLSRTVCDEWLEEEWYAGLQVKPSWQRHDKGSWLRCPL